MNKSVMKCCICNNENIGEFITINDKKYHLCCIEQLQQENKKLNGAIQTYDILLKTNVEEKNNLEQALDETKKYIKNNKRKSETRIYGLEIPEFIFYGEIEDIEKIIQKAKGDVKNEN